MIPVVLLAAALTTILPTTTMQLSCDGKYDDIVRDIHDVHWGEFLLELNPTSLRLSGSPFDGTYEINMASETELDSIKPGLSISLNRLSGHLGIAESDQVASRATRLLDADCRRATPLF